jgi:hypothetical protein
VVDTNSSNRVADCVTYDPNKSWNMGDDECKVESVAGVEEGQRFMSDRVTCRQHRKGLRPARVPIWKHVQDSLINGEVINNVPYLRRKVCER